MICEIPYHETKEGQNVDSSLGSVPTLVFRVLNPRSGTEVGSWLDLRRGLRSSNLVNFLLGYWPNAKRVQVEFPNDTDLREARLPEF